MGETTSHLIPKLRLLLDSNSMIYLFNLGRLLSQGVEQ
jgi:hypothetical protein